MTARVSRATHAVLDTDATSWLLDPRPLPQAENIRSFLGGRARVVSFVTVTELRYGALRAGWGQLRLRGLDRSLGDLEVIQTNESLVAACAELRNEAARIGHPLGQKVHDADRWVATTALVLGLELAAGDGVFEGLHGFDLHRVRLP